MIRLTDDDATIQGNLMPYRTVRFSPDASLSVQPSIIGAGRKLVCSAAKSSLKLALLCSLVVAAYDTAAACEPEVDATGTEQIVATASKLTGSFDDRSTIVHDFDSAKRAVWSNLPASFLSRPGVRLGDMDDEQLGYAFAFLDTALGNCGMEMVKGILGAEEVLSTRQRARRLGWSADNYWLAIYGKPSVAEAWAWGFGGHHLAINATMDSGRMYLSPTFLGIEPAYYRNPDGAELRPFGDIVSLTAELLETLEANRLEESRIRSRPRELHAGAGKDGYVPPLEGGKVNLWNESEQSLLLQLVGKWVNMMPPEFARQRMDEIKTGAGNLHFAWQGSQTASERLYFRVQSASDELLLEFSMQGGVGARDEEGHYHSIYRDPSNEYGRSGAD